MLAMIKNASNLSVDLPKFLNKINLRKKNCDEFLEHWKFIIFWIRNFFKYCSEEEFWLELEFWSHLVWAKIVWEGDHPQGQKNESINEKLSKNGMHWGWMGKHTKVVTPFLGKSGKFCILDKDGQNHSLNDFKSWFFL